MFRDYSNGIEEYITSIIGFIIKCNLCNHPNSDRMYIPQPEAMNCRLELPLSRSGTLTRNLKRNPAMPSYEPSNRQSVNTGLRLNRTTPALTLVGCGKPIQTTKGSTAESCPVTRAYRTS